MSKSFADLMKQRKQQRKSLTEKMNSLNGGQREEDTRFWSHKHIVNEKTKKGYAKIRFLPAPDGELDPWVMVLGYFNQNEKNGFYYVHNSHHTFDKEAHDPAFEYNGQMFEKYGGYENAKNHLIRRQKKYFSNILVLEDHAEPDNNGKVFLFEYGPQIFKKIQEAFQVDEEAGETEEDSVDVFDPIEGATFHLKVTPQKLGNQQIHTYETSTFLEPSPIDEDEDMIGEIWSKCYSLQEFVDPTNTKMFKPVEQQQKDFDRWLGKKSKPIEEKSEDESDFESDDEDVLLSDDNDIDASDDDIPWDNEDDESDDDIDDFFNSLKD